MSKLPDLDWPSGLRGPMHVDEARRVAAGLDLEAGLAYLYAAFVADWELLDGRSGRPLHVAAEAFCAELARIAAQCESATHEWER